MVAPLVLPLVLVSELKAEMNSTASGTDVDTRLRRLISASSAVLQHLCQRRFDLWRETRRYTSNLMRYQGDVRMTELVLDADLIEATSVINGDGATLSEYTLLPTNRDPNGVIAYRRIRLNPLGSNFWRTTGAIDSAASIQITGLWGYGGQWVAADATLSAALDNSAATVLVSNGAAFEAGMMLRLEDEFCYVESVSGDTLTVTRAYNGTLAASHASGLSVTRFYAHDLVQALVRRICLWRLEQNKSPLFGQAVIGDVTLPISSDGLPRDVVQQARTSGLIRAKPIEVI